MAVKEFEQEGSDKWADEDSQKPAEKKADHSTQKSTNHSPSAGTELFRSQDRSKIFQDLTQNDKEQKDCQNTPGYGLEICMPGIDESAEEN